MKLIRLLHEILREIFDEAAYERFCKKTRVSEGRDSYSEFLRDRQQRPRPRCC